MRSPLYLLFCGVVVVVFTTAAALFLGLRNEGRSLGITVTRLAKITETEFSKTVLLASVLSQHQSIVDIAHGGSAATALDTLVIQTGLNAILVHDEHGQVLAAGHRRPFGAMVASPPTNPNGLSKRFVLDEARGGVFVVSYPIKGAPEGKFVTLHRTLEDQALYWRAVSDSVQLTGPDGETLYAHDRNFGWSPLEYTVRSSIHGTALTLTRDPKVLARDAAVGFFIGVILVMAVVLWWLNAKRRKELAQVRLDALADDAQRLERLVTARTRALRDSQSQVIQTAKFKVLNDMASGLAHEFSQPLFALDARLDTLAFELEDDRHMVALDKARAQTKRMGQILNSLKTFARDGDVAPRLIALPPVTQSALALLDHRLKRTGITLHHITPDPPHSGVANATRLSQVIVNVISNSLDAMDQDGEITISYGPGPVIVIQDNGPGFLDLDQALEPFVTTKEGQNGLGLGLSISRDIMRSFGGDLDLRNADAGGAIVQLTFGAHEGELE